MSPLSFAPEHSEGGEKPKMFKLEKRTYVDANFKVVAESDPSVAMLLGAEGAEIDEALAEKAGLLTKNASKDGTEDKSATKKAKG